MDFKNFMPDLTFIKYALPRERHRDEDWNEYFIRKIDETIEAIKKNPQEHKKYETYLKAWKQSFPHTRFWAGQIELVSRQAEYDKTLNEQAQLVIKYSNEVDKLA